MAPMENLNTFKLFSLPSLVIEAEMALILYCPPGIWFQLNINFSKFFVWFNETFPEHFSVFSAFNFPILSLTDVRLLTQTHQSPFVVAFYFLLFFVWCIVLFFSYVNFRFCHIIYCALCTSDYGISISFS